MLLDSDELAVRFNDENMTIHEFKNQYEIVGTQTCSMKRKRMPKTGLNNITKLYKKISEETADGKYNEKMLAKKISKEFMYYFATLFKNYQKFMKKPENLKSWSPQKVFNEKAFLETVDDSTDFYRDLFLTRTWLVFLEGKLVPENIQEVQNHKKFDELIVSVQNESYFTIKNILPEVIKEDAEEEENFVFPFMPNKKIQSSKEFEKVYLSSTDDSGINIKD